MKRLNSILSVSTTELKMGPTSIMRDAGAAIISISARKKVVAYMVAPHIFERLTQALTDQELECLLAAPNPNQR